MPGVVTLDAGRFARCCRTLAGKVQAGGFDPDVVVGIRTGGEYVARGMAEAFHGSPRLESVDLQRPSTRRKSPLRSFLARLPRPVADVLRIVESRMLALRRPSVREFDRLPGSLCGLGRIKILLVDDAVDSGATMLAVANALRRVNPEAVIRTAAVTVTTRSPHIIPDYSLFKDLMRFPWSMDAKK